MSRFYNLYVTCVSMFAVSHDSLARLFQLNIFLVYSSYSLENCWEHSAARVDDMLATKIIKSVSISAIPQWNRAKQQGDERLTIKIFVEASLSYSFYVWHQDSNCWLPLNCSLKKLPVVYCFPPRLCRIQTYRRRSHIETSAGHKHVPQAAPVLECCKNLTTTI